MSEPVEKPFVCLECGATFAFRQSEESRAAGHRAPIGTLENHWREAKHGPRDVQRMSVDRFRLSIAGEANPERQSFDPDQE